MGARVASHGEDCRSSAGSDCGEDRAGASPSDYGNHCTSSNDLNASAGSRNDRTDADANASDYYGGADANLNAITSSGNNRTDANGYYGVANAYDYHGCPHGGDHLPCDECRLFSTNDNHGNDNHGCRLRAVTNNSVERARMRQVAGSFGCELWRFDP